MVDRHYASSRVLTCRMNYFSADLASGMRIGTGLVGAEQRLATDACRYDTGVSGRVVVQGQHRCKRVGKAEGAKLFPRKRPKPSRREASQLAPLDPA